LNQEKKTGIQGERKAKKKTKQVFTWVILPKSGCSKRAKKGVEAE